MKKSSFIESTISYNRQEESGDDDVGSLRVDRGVFDLESLWHEEKENSEAAVVDDEDWN